MSRCLAKNEATTYAGGKICLKPLLVAFSRRIFFLLLGFCCLLSRTTPLLFGSASRAVLRRLWRRLWRGALNFLLPPLCPCCSTPVTDEPAFCSACFSKLRFTKKPFCQACSFPFEGYVKHESLCFACRSRPPAFDRAFAPLLYDEASSGPILALKHADQTQHAPLFARLMMSRAPKAFRRHDLVVPIPIHPKRLRRRLYNQAALLARLVGRHWSLPIALDVLERSRYTPPLGDLPPRKRLLVLRRVFFCRREERVRGKSVLLVDDVVTSGLTAEFCARCLKRAGAKEVSVLAIARVPLARPKFSRAI